MRAGYERRERVDGPAVEHRPATVDDVYRIACHPEAKDNGKMYQFKAGGGEVVLTVERYLLHEDGSLEMVTLMADQEPAQAGQGG